MPAELISHTQRYEQAWRELRLRTTIVFATLFGGFLVVPLLVYGMHFLFSVDAILWVGIAWGAAFLGASFHRAMFPCPRCGKAFFLWYLYGNHMSRKCLHCGLRIGSPYISGQNTIET